MNQVTIDRELQGQRIRFARRAAGLTQEDLAEMVSDRVTTAISNNIISEIEKGKRGVWNDEILALVDILDQPQEWLEGRGGTFNVPKGVCVSWDQLALAV